MSAWVKNRQAGIRRLALLQPDKRTFLDATVGKESTFQLSETNTCGLAIEGGSPWCARGSAPKTAGIPALAPLREGLTGPILCEQPQWSYQLYWLPFAAHLSRRPVRGSRNLLPSLIHI